MSDRLSFVALVTCFNDDETINYGAVRKQVRRQVEAGNNIMCCGTNGDFTSLTFDEKVRLCAEVVEEVDGAAQVLVNAGMPSTYETVLLAKEFEKLGVDAISVITPFFIACTQQGLISHFATVADKVTKPVYMYDIPSRTQNHIEPETAARLAEHGNIAGIKDSGGGQDSLDAYLEIANSRDDFDVFSGPDSLIYYALSKGAKGCISGLGNVMPGVLSGICREYNAGNFEEAKKRQDLFTALRIDLYALGYPPALVKRALYLLDNSVGASRQPALLPTQELDGKIMAILEKHGLVAA
ncbi:dihydrodipicolinate synthase family protein [Telmatospirillum sp. J64-1]|uniref:dihydrodipicolinate synthase family protein n=1 Tax=Telmatospirillum sp. J64-1 TaxID=2502183 RepID=UPI002103816F|nr:dihydrodipicolinate synthase family protein [Telmatospirillum sp. J64-1]